MGLGDKARTAADIARVIMHAEKPRGQMDPVAQSLDDLWAYLTNKAREIDKNWLHELNGYSGNYRVEYLGSRKTPKKDRAFCITCPKPLYKTVLDYMQGRGVHVDDEKAKRRVFVSVAKVVDAS